MSWAKKQLWTLRLRASGPVLSDLERLHHWQSMRADDLRGLEEERLRALLRFAHGRVPYYRRMLEAEGVVSEDHAVELPRFWKLPLLDKTTLRHEFEELKATDLRERDWYLNSSGGSTGEPARFIQDGEFHAWVVAIKLLFDEWTGCRIGDRKVVLWGSSRDVDGSKHPLRTRVGRWLANERWLPAYGLSDGDMLRHARAIDVIHPAQLLAYVESAYELSLVLDKSGTIIRPPGAVMTSAGTLYPAMRSQIAEQLKAPIFDRYGSREVGDVACECDHHEGLHVCSPVNYVEVLRADGSPASPGEEGEIVVTNLVNFAMPLIRYRIGDSGAWATRPCSCGRQWPLLAKVTGRMCDTLFTMEGNRIGGEYFVHELRVYDWLKRFQLIQETVDELQLFLQPMAVGVAPNEGKLEEIRTIIRRGMGEKLPSKHTCCRRDSAVALGQACVRGVENRKSGQR